MWYTLSVSSAGSCFTSSGLTSTTGSIHSDLQQSSDGLSSGVISIYCTVHESSITAASGVSLASTISELSDILAHCNNNNDKQHALIHSTCNVRMAGDLVKTVKATGTKYWKSSITCTNLTENDNSAVIAASDCSYLHIAALYCICIVM